MPSFTEYKRVMAFKSHVASVNSYPKGNTVGYDRTYTLKRDSKLANITVGYSDGYRRAFTNKGIVLINGHRVPVVGKVSMNTLMVDVTDVPTVKSGDEVVLLQAGAWWRPARRRLKTSTVRCWRICIRCGVTRIRRCWWRTESPHIS